MTIRSCLAIGLGLMATACQTGPKPLSDEDSDAIAEQLVVQTARVREGELVLITGNTRNQQLLEDLAVQVRRRGAHPMISVSSDRLTRRLLVDVPVQYDEQAPELRTKLADMFDVEISIDAFEREDLLSDVAPERVAAQTQAVSVVDAAMLRSGVRRVFVGNEMYPTADAASRTGVDIDELSTSFWAAVAADRSVLQSRGAALRVRLEAGREVRITHPNGTDLTFEIQGRPVLVSDGVISEEDEQRGGAATMVWLPAGEVYLVPVQNSASGVIAVEREVYEGEVIEELRLVFDSGNLVSMTAESGIERLQAQYAVQGPGKDQFAAFDIGINPDLDASRVHAWIPAGMVTVGFGENQWAGGNNASGWSFYTHLSGATVTLDGSLIIENGKLTF